MARKIYIVVPVFNRKALTERFLQCLRTQTFRTFETIIVDDGSTDGTPELVTERFEEVRLLRGNGELWWTGATNLGIQHAMALASDDDAILVINDDLEIDSDYLERLHRASEELAGALIGSVVVDLNNPDLIVDGGRIVNWWTAKCRILNIGRKLSNFPNNHLVDVSLLTGWGTLIPVQVFRKIGLYDDRHFQQCGDTELPARARNAGYRLVVSYRAVIKVHVEASDNINVTARYSLRDIKKYFWGVKSNFRLKYRLFFGINAIPNPVMRLSFLLCDTLRITSHFFLRLRFR